MKKVLFTCLLLVALVSISLFFFKDGDGDAEVKSMINLKSAIGEFSALDEDKQIKIKEIITEKIFDDSSKIMLFLQENNSLGYAILKEENLVSVVYGDNTEKGYDQYKNYLIVYGKKPNKSNQELQITLNTDNNNEDIKKTISLDGEEYFLFIEKLPKEIKKFRILSENYIYK